METDWQRYYRNPSIRWAHEGAWGGEIAGGPIKQAGYYIFPFCHPMCCRPEGPFETREAARKWAISQVEHYNPNKDRWRRRLNPLRRLRPRREFEKRHHWRCFEKRGLYLLMELGVPHRELGRKRRHTQTRLYWPKPLT